MISKPIEVYIEGRCKGKNENEEYGANAFIATFCSKVLDKGAKAVRYTNNYKISVLSLIAALDYLIANQLDKKNIVIYTTSRYVFNNASNIKTIRKNKFSAFKGGLMQNSELWFKVSKQLTSFPQISFVYDEEPNITDFHTEVKQMCSDKLIELKNQPKKR